MCASRVEARDLTAHMRSTSRRLTRFYLYAADRRFHRTHAIRHNRRDVCNAAAGGALMV